MAQLSHMRNPLAGALTEPVSQRPLENKASNFGLLHAKIACCKKIYFRYHEAGDVMTKKIVIILICFILCVLFLTAWHFRYHFTESVNLEFGIYTNEITSLRILGHRFPVNFHIDCTSDIATFISFLDSLEVV